MAKEKVMKIENKYPWSGGAPLPQVFANSLNLFVMYYLQESIYIPNGKTMSITKDMPDNIGIVTFKGAYAHKLEGINEEVISFHPYFKGKSIIGYDIYLIENSKWLKEIIKINSNHPYHKNEYYKDYKHYFFVFHDEMFQCIAKDFVIEKVTKSYNEVTKELSEKILIENNLKIFS